MTRTLAGLAVATLVGLAVSRLFTHDLTVAERAAWGLACGLLIHAGLYTTGILLRLSPGPRKLLLAEAVVLGAALLLRERPRGEPAPSAIHPAPHAAWIAGVAAAAAGVSLFTLSALAEPIWTTDFLAIWGLKGKTIFFSSGIPDRLFRDPELAWSHPEYPLFLPLLFASLAAFARDWNDQALAVLYPLFQVVTILAAFGFLSRRVGRLAGLIAAALIGLFLPLYRAGHVGMADIPLAFGMVLLSCAFLDALQAPSPAARLRMAVASLFCAATKQEGLIYVLLLAATMLWMRRSRRTPWPFRDLTALVLPAAAHWALLRAARGALRNRDFDWTLLAPARWMELIERLGEASLRVLTAEAWPSAMAVVAIAALLILTRRGPADVLLVPLVVQVLLYVAVSALSAFGVAWLVTASFGRLVSTVFPVLALVLGGRIGALLASSVNPNGHRAARVAVGES